MANVEQDLIDIMKYCGIDTVLTLPCDRIKNLLPLLSENFKDVPMTREEDGIGIAAGLFLSGKRPAMVIQSTGIGNSLNVLASLHKTYSIPLPILASWRGVYKEGIEAQLYFGKCLPDVLEAMGIPYIIADSYDDLPKIRDAILTAYSDNTPYVVLMSPKMWEGSTARSFVPEVPPGERQYDIHGKTIVPAASHTRYEMIRAITPYLKDKSWYLTLACPARNSIMRLTSQLTSI